MGKYEYKDPLKRGFRRFNLTKEQHDDIFPNKKLKWYDKYEYYYNDHIILLLRFHNWKSVLLATLLFPVTTVIHGISNTKEIWKELIDLHNQKKSGFFFSDTFDRKTEQYQQVMSIVKKDKIFYK